MNQATDHKARLRAERAAIERPLLVEALTAHGGNVTRCAEALKLSRRGLQLRIRELGLREEAERLRNEADRAAKTCAKCGHVWGGAA